MVSINEPFEFRCGLKLKNRIVKAAMEESLSSGDNQPNEYIYRLYKEWARSSFGLMLTGNVQVDERYPGMMTDIMVPRKDRIDLNKWKEYASVCQSEGTPTIVQLNHAGRQSFIGKRPFGQSPIAPSAVSLSLGDGIFAGILSNYVLPSPREMTQHEIDETIEKFVDAAKLMYDAGFAGVEIHASHGYLVSSFLSPKTNLRTDKFGGNARNRMCFLFELIDRIRDAVPSSFAVGVKLNSADFSSGGLTEEQAAEQIEFLDEHGAIDFIEISGGTYEAPAMVGANVRTKKREAYFIEFASKVRNRTKIPLIVTGGFRTRRGMNEALRENSCDLIGIGRPVCVQFDLPKILLDPNVSEQDAKAISYKIRGENLFRFVPIQFIGSGIGTLWHNWQMHRVAIDRLPPDPNLSVQQKLLSIFVNFMKTRLFLIVLVCFLIVFIYFREMFVYVRSFNSSNEL